LAPLALFADPKEPQFPAGVQLQLTPAFAESFDTDAAMVVTAVTPMVFGGSGCRATKIDAGGTVVVFDAVPVPPPQALNTAGRADRIRNAIFAGTVTGNREDTSTSWH
jgi:hypothetical protein